MERPTGEGNCFFKTQGIVFPHPKLRTIAVICFTVQTGLLSRLYTNKCERPFRWSVVLVETCWCQGLIIARWFWEVHAYTNTHIHMWAHKPPTWWFSNLTDLKCGKGPLIHLSEGKRRYKLRVWQVYNCLLLAHTQGITQHNLECVMWFLDRTVFSFLEKDNNNNFEADSGKGRTGNGGELKRQRKRKKTKKQEPQQQKQRWRGNEKGQIHFQKPGAFLISSEWAHSLLRQIISSTNN